MHNFKKNWQFSLEILVLEIISNLLFSVSNLLWTFHTFEFVVFFKLPGITVLCNMIQYEKSYKTSVVHTFNKFNLITCVLNSFGLRHFIKVLNTVIKEYHSSSPNKKYHHQWSLLECASRLLQQSSCHRKSCWFCSNRKKCKPLLYTIY